MSSKTGSATTKKAQSKSVGAKPTDIQLAPEQSVAVVPDHKNLSAVADELFRSGLFPQTRNKYGTLAIIEYGRELGLRPVVALQTMSVIKGRICIESKAMLALAIEKGIKYKVLEKTSKVSRVEFKRDGFDAHTESFTIEDARAKGFLTKENWKMYPEEMCFWRCVSKGLRAYAPDIIMGLYTIDEMGDAVDDEPEEEEVLEGEVVEEEAQEPQIEVVEEEETKETTPVTVPPTTEEVMEDIATPVEKKEESVHEDSPPDEAYEEKKEEQPAEPSMLEKIKQFLEDRAIDVKHFKAWLGEVLQTQKKYKFVEKKFGHWSFSEADPEQLNVFWEYRTWIIGEYVTWAMDNKPKSDEELP